MKPLPSSLNNILRARYLQEAVDTSAPTYNRKKEEEVYPVRFAPTTSTVQPELTMPKASEFPRPWTLRDIVLQSAQQAADATPTRSPRNPMTPYIEGAKEIGISPTQFGTQKATTPEALAAKERTQGFVDVVQNLHRYQPGVLSPQQQENVIKILRRYRDLGGRQEKGVLDLSTVPEQIKRLEDLAKTAKQKAIETGKGMIPDVKSTLRGVPYQAAHLGLGYYPFVAGAAATDIESLPDDPILGLDPVSFSGGMAAAEMATPYMVDLPLALARGSGVASGLKTAGQAALAGLGRLPYFAIPYGMAYGTYQLQDWSNRENEPRFRKMMRDYEIEQAKLQTKRRKEGREERFGEALGRTMQLNDILQSYGGPGHFARPF